MRIDERSRRRSDGLSSRAAHAFSAGTLSRAQRYARRVRLVDIAARTVTATVRGSRPAPYEVAVAAPVHLRGVLRCRCSCPMGTQGAACKHMLATLLALDQYGLDLGAEGAALEVRIEEPAGLADAPHEDDDDARGQIACAAASRRAPPASRVSVTRAPRTARAPGWVERLAWLEADDQGAPPAGAPAFVEYHLITPRLAGGDGLPPRLPEEIEVRTFRRRLRQDGTPGAQREPLRRVGSRPDTFAPLDAAALQALAAAVPIEVATGVSSWGSGWERDRAWEGARVHAAIVDRVLPAVCATGRAGWLRVDRDGPGAPREEFQPVRWDGDVPFQLVAEVRAVGDAAELDVGLTRGDERLPLSALTAVLGAGAAAVGDRLVRVDGGVDLARWRAVVQAGPVRVARRQVGTFVTRLADALSTGSLTIDHATGWRVADVEPVPHLELEQAGGWFVGRIAFAYGGVRRPRRSTRTYAVDTVQQVLFRAAPVREAALIAGLHARGGERRRHTDVTAELELEAAALFALLPALEADGWQVWLRKTRVRSGARITGRVSSGIDWLDLQLDASFDGEAADPAALVEALRDGQQLVRLRDGSHGVMPAEWLERHRALARVGELEDGVLRVPRTRAMLLDVLLADLPEVTADARFRKLRGRLTGFAGIAPGAEPKRFAGTLRPYQREGLGWLGFLREIGFGGCLADDMGLGKTVQVLAALAEHRRGRRSGRPWLVVAPKSVVWNWMDEARRFVPGIRAVEYTGRERTARRAELARAELVVTTYATMRLDAELLSGIEFDTVVLDEAQTIKNPDAQVTKAARLLRAEHRLALSGTPVENHLGDLGSIFEFLNPGMLGDVGTLRALTAARTEPPGELAPLARALRPFLLRRTKAQVLPDLPARTEQVLHCKLEGAQRRFYDQLRDGYRASLLARVARDGMARSTMHVLEALLRLRQAACFPGLVTPARAADGSAKLDLLIERLVEVRASGQKALVFSQFTKLLAEVRTRLEAAGIEHEYLDGKTRDRAERCARFQSDAGCGVFLISLKAGGTGLNLTAASYVFLLDPWWNPAVEAQAIDRSHRLGQTQPVFAYRLIAEGTVEDKILELQRSKRELLEGLFAENTGQLASLSADDLAVLLAG